MDSTQDGEWEVPRRAKNRAGSRAAKLGSPQSSTQAWGQIDFSKKLGTAPYDGTKVSTGSNLQTQAINSKRQAGRVNAISQSINRGWENSCMTPATAIPPPLQDGWQWASRASSSQTKVSEDEQGQHNVISEPPQGSPGGKDSTSSNPNVVHDDEDDDDDDDLIDDMDDDNISSDDLDSDASQKSHETRKKNNWLKAFFETFDNLANDKINDPEISWHCPACKGGPGAVMWYRGLQPLLTHAKTKRAQRVKLHREFAEVLEEELHRRGSSAVPAGEAFGKWKGLSEMVKDRAIVWPPMVVIQNTRLEKKANEKWIGMGNQELLECFSSYNVVKARHSYGPQGHRGMSVLIFERDAMGYFEAERLERHFTDQRTDREAWDNHRILFHPGGIRQLYGYMATKEDLDTFNQHSQEKSKLKFEIRSYIEMVLLPMKQQNEDNQQLIYVKNKAEKEQKHSKALEQSLGAMSEKLRKTMEENNIVRQRTKRQHEQYKEEMDNQEQFFMTQINTIHQALVEKERTFEKLLQEEREKIKKLVEDSGTKKEQKRRGEEVARFIESQDKGIEEFQAQRENLIKMHEDKKTELKRRYFEEEMALEREFDAALSQLMEQYTPHSSEKDGE